MKRPDWDQYFISLARGVSRRSECHKRQVGALIIDEQKRILSTGYNGFAKGEKNPCEETCLKSTGQECPAVHAELNAMLNCGDLHRADTIYITRRPCKRCIQHMANTSIKRIVLPACERKEKNLNPLPVQLSYVFVPEFFFSPAEPHEAVMSCFTQIAEYHKTLGYPKPWDTEEERAEQFRHITLAMQMEVAEITASMPWKPWRKAEDQTWDWRNLTEELVDLLFFMGSAMELYNISPTDFTKAFQTKLATNYKRIQNGYNKSKEDM